MGTALANSTPHPTKLRTDYSPGSAGADLCG